MNRPPSLMSWPRPAAGGNDQTEQAVPLQDVTSLSESKDHSTEQPAQIEIHHSEDVKEHEDFENAPLLDETGGDEAINEAPPPSLRDWQLAGLYTSHSLSMWNSRCYEFAAVLFAASAYPHTLTIASLRGLSANLASLLLSPAVGHWCNNHRCRLRTLQTCIVIQRICIFAACLGWVMIVQAKGVDQDSNEVPVLEFDPIWLKHAIMACLLLLGMLEKLSWVGNLIVMERDWVPLLASPTSKPALHILNASIKRIDLISKLVAPLVISALALGFGNLRVTAFVIAAMQVLTVGPELWTAWMVWKSAPSLQRVKETKLTIDSSARSQAPILNTLVTWTQLFRRYAASSVVVPSLVWTIQPLSVLALSSSMMVYLLSIHFPLEQITIGRTASTSLEVASTILTPMLISYLRKRSKDQGEKRSNHLRPLITVGLLGISWQLFMLVPAMASLLALPELPDDPNKPYSTLTTLLFTSLALSRLGPFAYALAEQQLVQVTVPVDQRVEFSGTEMSLYSLSEVCRWLLTGVFGKPEQFKGVAMFSFAALATATASFWWWARRWAARLARTDCA